MFHSVDAHNCISLNLGVKQNRFHNEFPMLCSVNAAPRFILRVTEAI